VIKTTIDPVKNNFVNTMDSFASGFAGVDAAGDANSFVTYLDLIHSMPFFKEDSENPSLFFIRTNSAC